ncbi:MULTISPECIES: competence protein ComK [Oceanobacillus]|uniref:Competence protein n=1 Tax=Oceanobacillus neutriphilus TaxID=531815 RepID=A0ABQ2NN13_9BACI|nr:MULTISPECIES: competence protein ComK [Oceanobacillus]MCT1902078.1 competence protein ComK [Oceanobacillus sojae]GGP07509.1 competence protein [Oceanobacillus neutriphilus]
MSPCYKITDKTMAILPVGSPKNTSKVFESDQKKTLTFKEMPLSIIEKNCLRYFSSYNGRRAAVLYHEPNYKMKTPIPISSTKGIIAFPTQGPSRIDCAWIFYNHVAKIVKREGGSAVIFKNGTELFQPVSKNTLFGQLVRCHNLGHMIESSEESESPLSANLLDLQEESMTIRIGKNPVISSKK